MVCKCHVNYAWNFFRTASGCSPTSCSPGQGCPTGLGNSVSSLHFLLSSSFAFLCFSCFLILCWIACIAWRKIDENGIKYDKIGFWVWRFEFCTCFDMLGGCSGPVWTVFANRFWGHASQCEVYSSDWPLEFHQSFLRKESIRIHPAKISPRSGSHRGDWQHCSGDPHCCTVAKYLTQAPGTRLKGLEAGGLWRVNVYNPKRADDWWWLMAGQWQRWTSTHPRLL